MSGTHDRAITIPLAVAHFLRFYGAGALRGPGWPTRDGVIPWGLFWLLYHQLRHVTALERLNEAQAVAQAIAMAFSGDKFQTDTIMQQELLEAFPETPKQPKAKGVTDGD